MLTTRIKLEIAGGVLAMIVIGMVGGSWLGAREEGIKLKATLDAQNSVLADAGKREDDRDSALKSSLQALQDLQKRTQTPSEVVKQLPAVLPLPQPITLNLPPAAPQTPASPGAPPTLPVPTANLPAEDLKPLFDFAANCKEDQARVVTLTADKADDQAKITALTTERDAAVKAAKGGSKWQRFKTAAKWVGIGIGIGAVAALATHK